MWIGDCSRLNRGSASEFVMSDLLPALLSRQPTTDDCDEVARLGRVITPGQSSSEGNDARHDRKVRCRDCPRAVALLSRNNCFYYATVPSQQGFSGRSAIGDMRYPFTAPALSCRRGLLPSLRPGAGLYGQKGISHE